MNEKTEIALREIIFDNIDEYEPEFSLADNATLDEAIAVHEDLFRTHYKFTDKDFDQMVVDIMRYYRKRDNDITV